MLPTVLEALAGYELLQATSLHEAERLVLESGIDLFVLGIHLDDSRCLPLIKFIRSNKHHSTTPIIVVRLLPSANPQILRHTLDAMKTIHGISDYLELEGDPQSASKIRERAEKCLPAQGLAAPNAVPGSH